MAKLVKVILFLLLTMLLQEALSNTSSALRVEDRDIHIAAVSVPQEVISIPDLPSSPFAELVSNMYANHQITMSRIHRVVLGEYFFNLRSILLSCADRQNSLSQHKRRIYNTTISYFCQSVSEYYVFALRHIII